MTNTTSEQTGKKGKPPVARVKVGPVKIAIWARETDTGVFYSATCQRDYRDADGEWQTTDSFGEDNLLALAKAADLAHTKIAALKAADKAAKAVAEAGEAEDAA